MGSHLGMHGDFATALRVRMADVSHRYNGRAGRSPGRRYVVTPCRGILKWSANKLRRAQDRMVARGEEPTHPRSIPTDGDRWSLL